jgi:purine-binding chemotaxis protein CheW
MTEAFVVFEVNGTRYAVRAEDVIRVEMVESITRVPNAPSFVEGVAPVRGEVIPVISLRKRFDLPAGEIGLRSRLVVVRVGERTIGMLADSAREFLRAGTEQIKPVPSDLSGAGQEYLEGVLAIRDRLTLIVNLAKLVNREEQAALESRSALESAESQE